MLKKFSSWEIKKNLTPEPRQTLTIGETFSFTAPKAQSLQKIQLPKEKRTVPQNDKITEKSKDNASIQTNRKGKAHFAPWTALHALYDSFKVISQSLPEKEQMVQLMAQSSSAKQMQKDFQETILQTNNTTTNDQISVQLTKEKRSGHQEKAKQHPQKAMAYWDIGTKKMETTSLSSSEKLSLSPETKEEHTPKQIQTLKSSRNA